MSSGSDGGQTATAALERVLSSAPDAIPEVLSAVAPDLGMARIGLYLADLQQELLVPWGVPGGSVERVRSSSAGRAFRRGEPVAATEDGWWLPVSDNGDRLGVVHIEGRGDGHQRLLAHGHRLAALLGLLITSRRLRSDGLILACRAADVSLAAELRWAMLPPRSLVTGDVSVSGHLEPAYEIAGDSFDYALNGDVLHLGVFDAMGHGMAASRLANLAVGSYRNSRRRGRDLPEMYVDLDQAIESEFGGDVFVTAHLAKLELSSGLLSVVNAGHPRAQLIRAGKAHPLDFAPATPIGLGFVAAEVGQLRLEPGDSVIILSDGVTEARSAGGDLFGVDRVGDLAVRALAGGESAPETVRRLIGDLLDHRGTDLEDDATVLLFQWHPDRSSGRSGER